MELPVVIAPLPDQGGFVAHLAAPFNLSARAATADEAHQQITALLQTQLQRGVELRAIHVAADVKRDATPGWLPDDDLTRDWLENVQQFRAECDAADRRRLLDSTSAVETPS